MATLVRWDPLRGVASLHTELSRLMNGLDESNARQPQAWVPSLDVWETEDTVSYAFDLPGVAKDDIAIEVEDGVLTVSASREHSREIDADAADEGGNSDDLASVAQWLGRHGVSARTQLETTSVRVGEALLSRAADQGVDLIVMGAFGHSRWRERLLGGTTRDVLGSMTVPVLMSH